jgi:hypothetical protein
MEALNLTAIFGGAAAGGGGGGDIDIAAADRYVSSDGNDTASGAESAPWRTFSKVVQWVASLPSGGNVRIIVKSGHYFEQNSGLYYGNLNGPITVTTEFEPGVSATTCQIGGAGGNGIGCKDSVTATFNLRGATFVGFDQSSANGIGLHNSAVAIVNGGGSVFTGYTDGWSNHNTSTATVRDCTFSNSSKGAFTHVDSSTCVAEGCTFVGRSGAVLGVGAMQNLSTGTFEDCIFVGAVDRQAIDFLNSTILRRCIIGLPGLALAVGNVPGSTTVFEDCYLSMFFSGLASRRFTRCYGTLSTIIRGLTAATPLIENCVFTSSGTLAKFCTMPNGFTVNSFDPGMLTIRNSIFTGYTHFIDLATGNVAASQDLAKDAINAQWTMEGLCINGVATVMSPATINNPSPYVTGNPLLANPTTTVQADYHTAPESPCRDAGVFGANIGLPV